jgi:Sortase and related acyltransferases
MTLVVTCGTDERGEDVAVAIGNVFPLDPRDASLAEVALLVDDSWHGHGIGRLLLAHLVEAAPRLGFEEMVAYVLAGNEAMRAPLDPTSWHSRPAPDLGEGASAFHLRLEQV